MIRVLEKHVADKIAAGEVVDRPVSIVKELVENALDAEASSITVEFRNGGRQYLRITDDGCGIPAEETELAFLRHATSKIRTEEDLGAIRSLGFRGEALASICAVARVDMITRPPEAKTGRHIICEGSKVLENTATGCPEGTTITVRDLFYNLPARRKFLGTDGAEARRIIDLMSRIALAYPDVRFRLLNGKSEVFHTSGRGSILDNIGRIYGREMSRDLVKVDAQKDGMLIRGFVSSPGTSVTARNRQFFCVNGRVVSSKTMERGLEKAYRERLFPGRFPIAFLFLQLGADQLDVNVHPTKREIRFDDDFTVEDFITEAVGQALEQKPAIPSVRLDMGRSEQTSAEGTQKKREHTGADISQKAPGSVQEKTTDEGSSDEQAEQMDIKNLLSNLRQQTMLREGHFRYDPAAGVSPPEACSDARLPGIDGTTGGQGPADIPDRTDQTDQTVQTGEHAPRLPRHDQEEHPRLAIEDLEVIGVVFQTYIIAAEGDTMYLIDQHAAHERVFYEQLLRQYHASEKPAQQLLLPLQISVSAELEQTEDNWIGHLRDMGYEIENFGPRTYMVRALPAFAREGEGEAFLRDLLLGLEEKPDLRTFAGLDRLIMRSCKSAVKGGDRLDPLEIKSLLRQLAACDRPWSCPHGRPTIIRMRRQELERMFKR